VSFLRRVGDYRLVLGSPEPRSLGSLAATLDDGAAAAGDKHAAALVAAQQQRGAAAGMVTHHQPQQPQLAPFSCRAQYYAVR
jgi:hypothetical protein